MDLCLPNDELRMRIKARLREILDAQAKKGLPMVYRNEMCIKDNQFIHEYPDGRRYLIEQNQQNSEETVLCEL